jgi:putative PIN family toxin of toxin-antitoxin system
MRVVIDTNVLLVCLSPRSEGHWLWQSLLSEAFEIYVTTDILNEYAEIITREMGQEVAEVALDLLTDLPNTHQIQKYFLWQLIEADPDDNKFVDCAIAAGAHYLVSEDRHIRIIRQYPYLGIELVSLSEFKEKLHNG